MNKKLSIILLSYYSEKRIVAVYKEVYQAMERENIEFELIVMDDGSGDNSYLVACNLEKTDKRVKSYRLSRNYTSHYSKFAGFSVCTGACAVSIPDDGQLPVEMVVKMYRLWEKGNKLIIPYRVKRKDSRLNNLYSGIYYRIMNALSDVTFPPGGADSFLADRELLDILNQHIHPINTSSIVEVLRMGFEPVFIPYVRPSSGRPSRWSFKKKYKLAKDTILSSSSFPIRFITYIGFLSFLISIVLIFVTSYLKITGKTSVGGVSMPGWTSTLAIISLFSGLILLSLGIIAEYIWIIFEEVKSRPGFIIRKKEDNIHDDSNLSVKQ